MFTPVQTIIAASVVISLYAEALGWEYVLLQCRAIVPASISTVPLSDYNVRVFVIRPGTELCDSSNLFETDKATQDRSERREVGVKARLPFNRLLLCLFYREQFEACVRRSVPACELAECDQSGEGISVRTSILHYF